MLDLILIVGLIILLASVLIAALRRFDANSFFDRNLKLVEITNVQPVQNKCYFARNGEWIASDLVATNQKELKADQEIEFGSDEFFRLVSELGRQNRQGELALYGNILLKVDGRTIRVRNPKKAG